jgi:hypothetical protein
MARTDVGRLNSWSITITPANGGTATKFSDGFGGNSGSAEPDALLMSLAAAAPISIASATPTSGESDRPSQPLNLSDSLHYQTLQGQTAAADTIAAATADASTSPSASTTADWLDYDAGDALSSDVIDLG